MSKLLPLSALELMNYPVLHTTVPHEDASDKYSLISSIDIINELKSYNWYPTSIQVAAVKDESRENKQVHCVRLRHFDDLISPQESAVEILFFNSFDRSKAFTISIGIYRFSCANGLVVGETFDSYKLRHIGDLENNLDEIITKITEFKPKLEQKIRDFSSLMLSQQEMKTYAKLSVPLKFAPHLEVDSKQLLQPHRDEDRRDTSLYTVMNILQENLIRSNNITGVNRETGRKFSSREITSLSKDYEINTGLFNLAERIYK
ncbi:MAG: hypothetical protein DRQ78_10425, partial [Epsilonproteobacteria bacterium]